MLTPIRSRPIRWSLSCALLFAGTSASPALADRSTVIQDRIILGEDRCTIRILNGPASAVCADVPFELAADLQCGPGTQPVNEPRWFVDGNPIATGSPIQVSLPAGSHSVSVSCGSCQDEIVIEAVSCTVVPQLDAAFSRDEIEEGAGIYLAPNIAPVSGFSFPYLKLLMRPFTLSASEPGDAGHIRLESVDEEVLELFANDGTPIALPASFAVSDLPASFLVNGTAFGNGRLRATYEPPSPGSRGAGDVGDGTSRAGTVEAGGSPHQDEVGIRVAPWPGLSGESIAAYPSFHFVDTYDTDDVMEAALDPTRSPERVGYDCDVYVVEHKSPVAWGANTDLIDVTGAVETITLNAGSSADNRVAVWSGGLDAGPLVSKAYDIVYDFGRDGRLDPGDLVDGFDANQAGAFVVKDLNTPGPYAVSQGDYSAGTYLTQRTYYPSNLAQLGTVPLVTIGHGNGHQYTWYDYLGQHLASHGYVVMSYRNNTGPGIETASTTTLTNLDYLLTHLDSVLGGVLEGHVDTHRIGWIGHSRGGEGVVRAYDRIFDGAWSPQGYEVEDVRTVASIAPTVYLTAAESDPHDVNYYLIVGGADGDVTGRPDLPGDQYFRISDRSLGISQTSYVHGATHNDFNCCGFDDGIGPDQIGRPEAQRVAKSYFLALMQLYLDGNPATREFFTRMYDDLPPSGIAPQVEIATTFREINRVGDFVIDDFQTQPALGTSSSNGAVMMTVANAYEGLNEDADVSYTWTPSDPMNGMIFYSGSGDFSRGLIFDHPTMETRWIEFEVVPAFRDVRGHRHLSLRACQGTRHPETVALNDAHSFAVTLRDENGVSSTVAFGSWGKLTPLYPRTGSGAGAGWVNEMNTVRIPLAEFEADGSGIDLSRIAAVRVELGAPYGSPRGRIGLDDVMFTVD